MTNTAHTCATCGRPADRTLCPACRQRRSRARRRAEEVLRLEADAPRLAGDVASELVAGDPAEAVRTTLLMAATAAAAFELIAANTETDPVLADCARASCDAIDDLLAEVWGIDSMPGDQGTDG